MYSSSGIVVELPTSKSFPGVPVFSVQRLPTDLFHPVELIVKVIDKITYLPIENVQTSIQLFDSPYTQLMNEDTLADGIASEIVSFFGEFTVIVKIRKSETTDDPRYKPDAYIGTVTSSGLNLTVTMQENTFI